MHGQLFQVLSHCCKSKKEAAKVSCLLCLDLQKEVWFVTGNLLWSLYSDCNCPCVMNSQDGLEWWIGVGRFMLYGTMCVIILVWSESGRFRCAWWDNGTEFSVNSLALISVNYSHPSCNWPKMALFRYHGGRTLTLTSHVLC